LKNGITKGMETNKNMTAIDFLVQELQKEYKWFPSTQSELILKAKEMEKMQLDNAYNKGFLDA